MKMLSMKVLAATILVGLSNLASAQVVQYIGCEVENGGEFAAMISRVREAMSESSRPTVTLVQNTFNGPSSLTHTVLLEFPDYEALQTWTAQQGQSQAAQLIFATSGHNQNCTDQGLVVERASWGERSGDWGYSAVFPVTTSDAEAYVEALNDVMTSDSAAGMPGETILYEARAGGTATHIIVASAPDFATLNNFLDTFFQSDDFADFDEDVAGIRTLGPRTQGRRVRTWQP